MKKDQLIAKIAQDAGITRKQAEAALNAFWGGVTETLKNGEKLFLVDYGTFEIKDRPERIARNPQAAKNPDAPKEITVPAAKIPVFKASARFKKNF